jgi:hypothetical protein
MTNAKKKELAQKLYMQNFFTTQKELAEYLEVTEQTLGKWIRAGKWEDMRESYLISFTEEMAFMKKQLRIMRENLESEGRTTFNNKEMDVITKLTAAIRNLKSEIGIEDVIDVSIKVVEWLRTHDVRKAQEAAETFHAYIKANS